MIFSLVIFSVLAIVSASNRDPRFFLISDKTDIVVKTTTSTLSTVSSCYHIATLNTVAASCSGRRKRSAVIEKRWNEILEEEALSEEIIVEPRSIVPSKLSFDEKKIDSSIDERKNSSIDERKRDPRFNILYWMTTTSYSTSYSTSTSSSYTATYSVSLVTCSPTGLLAFCG